jgi:hypothetical protein
MLKCDCGKTQGEWFVVCTDCGSMRWKNKPTSLPASYRKAACCENCIEWHHTNYCNKHATPVGSLGVCDDFLLHVTTIDT